jgi:hypothetical protein
MRDLLKSPALQQAIDCSGEKKDGCEPSKQAG